MHHGFTKRLVTLALLVLPLVLSLPAQARVDILDRIVAVVNDGVILASELEQRVERVTRRMRSRGAVPPPPDILREQVLDRLILETLQMQLAERANIKVSDTALNRALSSIAARNGMTLEEFAQSIRASGQSWKAFRQQVRRQMTISRLQRRRVSERVRVTDREIKQFLSSKSSQKLFKREYHLLHILLRTPSNATSEQVQEIRARARALVRKLRHGADFSQMAVAHSDGQFALEGGDLGWRPAARLPTLFAKAAADMKVGEISDPLRSGAGFHILKLVGKRGDTDKVIKQYRVRHILIDTAGVRGPQEAQKRIHELRKRIVQGGVDFAQLARQYSDDPGSARKGGLLGWVSPRQMVPTFTQVMKATAVGQVSKVFETRYGWHILKVLDVRTADMSQEYRHRRARRALRQRQFQEELRRWLQEIRGEAYIDIRLNENDEA